MVNINYINKDKLLGLGKKFLMTLAISGMISTTGCQNYNNPSQNDIPNEDLITQDINNSYILESDVIIKETLPIEEPKTIININELQFSDSEVSMDNTEFKLSDDLTQKINTTIKNYGGDCSFIAINLNDGMSFGYNVDKTYKTASTIKAPVSLYAFQEMDKGNGTLDELKTYEEKFRRDGSGILKNKKSGTKYTLKDLFYYTINYSDNVAYYMIHDRFYSNGYNEFLEELGCSQLYLNNGAKWGRINARSMAIIWQEIYKYKDETENGKHLFELFTNADYNYIKEGMDEYDSAHKSGWTPTEVHDSSIVFAEDDYIVVILNNNNGNYYGKNQLLKISSYIEEGINEYTIYKKNNNVKIYQKQINPIN